MLDETLALRDYDLKVNNIELERESMPDRSRGDGGSASTGAGIPQHHQQRGGRDSGGRQGRQAKSPHSFQRWPRRVEFLDSGPGIKDPNRIFDPFYTTKTVGKGTGLGLSICYGIIKEHGGDITAHNRPEGGAAIEVRLPASGQSQSPSRAVTCSRREMAIEGRILLVEDEEAVLEFERDVLVGAGPRW